MAESRDENIRNNLKWIKSNDFDRKGPGSLVGTRQASADVASGRIKHIPVPTVSENVSKNEYERIMAVARKNPMVPAGMGLTVCALVGGLYYMVKGNSFKQQQMMRARVFAQGATVATMLATVWAVGKWHLHDRGG